LQNIQDRFGAVGFSDKRRWQKHENDTAESSPEGELPAELARHLQRRRALYSVSTWSIRRGEKKVEGHLGEGEADGDVCVDYEGTD
jgi:hypothetical protein